MKTATAHDLTTRLPTILGWLEAGEEVIVRPDQCRPAASPANAPTVDWSKSAAFQRDHADEPMLSKQDLEDLYEEMGSRY